MIGERIKSWVKGVHVNIIDGKKLNPTVTLPIVAELANEIEGLCPTSRLYFNNAFWRGLRPRQNAMVGDEWEPIDLLNSFAKSSSYYVLHVEIMRSNMENMP